MIVNRKPSRSMVVICRLAAFLGAIVLVIGGGTIPASASQLGDGVYLENANTFGLYAKSGVTQGSQVAIGTQPWGGWFLYDEGSWTADGISGESYEFASVRTNGDVSDLCMAAAAGSDSAYIYLEPCGANGTVWVAVYSNGGFLLYSRYYLDQGAQAQLGDYTIKGDDAFLTINPTNPAIFHRWLDTLDDLY